MLLVLGFFTCGFQLAFITVHLPAYLVDRGLSATVGGWTLATIGLFNIVGSIYLRLARRPHAEALSAVVHLFRPRGAIWRVHCVSGHADVVHRVRRDDGLMWLSTVPPTNGIIAVMFGTRWLGTLGGFAFFSHQVGGFLGVWLGGIVFDRTGSYDPVWWLAILFGMLSALINMPIVEKPVARVVVAPA